MLRSCVFEIELIYSENFCSGLSFKRLQGQTMKSLSTLKADLNGEA